MSELSSRNEFQRVFKQLQDTVYHWVIPRIGGEAWGIAKLELPFARLFTQTFLAWLAVLWVCLGLALPRTAQGDSPRIDSAALSALGVKTQKLLATTPASWTATNTLANGVILNVSVRRAGGRSRTVFSVDQAGKQLEILRIVSRDGVWYVNDSSGSYKYRPYEMPAVGPIIYLCLERAAPVFVGPGSSVLSDKVESVDANVATYRHPLTPAQDKQMRGTLQQLDVLAAENPGKPLPPALVAQKRIMEELVAHGMPVRVDLATGQIVEFGTPTLRTKVSGFQFSAKVDESDFAIDNAKRQDFSDDPTAVNLNDLIMIGHQPGVQPGRKDYDLDARLLNIKSGRLRRVPFKGADAMPGCFLHDRRAVIVSGLDTDTGIIRPYQIDLVTGENRALGGRLLESGNTLGGDLSPDGKSVVMIHMEPASLLSMRICVIDIATGEARFIGKGMDTGYVSWTADGQHLVLLERHHQTLALTSPTTETIAMMDMQGTITRLLPGDSPVLLADRQTILYQAPGSDLWTTCDLRGQSVNLFADGLKGYGSASPAPDGKRILMMHYQSGRLPDGVVIPIGQSSGQVITTADGLWAMPTWR